MLLTIGQEEFLVPQTAFDTQNTKVQGLHFENNLPENVIGFAIIELESLQRKVDYQIGSIQAFKLLLKKGSVEHARIHANNVTTKKGGRLL